MWLHTASAEFGEVVADSAVEGVLEASEVIAEVNVPAKEEQV